MRFFAFAHWLLCGYMGFRLSTYVFVHPVYGEDTALTLGAAIGLAILLSLGLYSEDRLGFFLLGGAAFVVVGLIQSQLKFGE